VNGQTGLAANTPARVPHVQKSSLHGLAVPSAGRLIPYFLLATVRQPKQVKASQAASVRSVTWSQRKLHLPLRTSPLRIVASRAYPSGSFAAYIHVLASNVKFLRSIHLRLSRVRVACFHVAIGLCLLVKAVVVVVAIISFPFIISPRARLLWQLGSFAIRRRNQQITLLPIPLTTLWYSRSRSFILIICLL
jgi:hypothetical protein